MKRISLILILAILLSTLGVSVVSAQTPTGGTGEGGTGSTRSSIWVPAVGETWRGRSSLGSSMQDRLQH